MARRSEGRLRAEAKAARLITAGWTKAEAGRWRHPDRPSNLCDTATALYVQDCAEELAAVGFAPVVEGPEGVVVATTEVGRGIGPDPDPWELDGLEPESAAGGVG